MKSINHRIERIESLLKGKDNNQYKIKFRENAEFLPVIKIEASYLMFRIENSRTKRIQQKYLRNNPELNEDFFKDPEDRKVQEIQEELLLDLVLNHKDFIEDLKKYGQDEPAIITRDGFLVNGNRRTAALKSIGVEYIECAVLPENITPQEIYKLEQGLQIAETFKQDYHWVDELNNIRDGLTDERYMLSREILIKNLKISPQELTSRLLRLELVDRFLEWRKIPGQYDYSKLDETEQIFKEAAKGIKKYKDVTTQNHLLNMIFSLIESPPKTGRLYDHVRDIIKNPKIIYEDLKKTKLKTKKKSEKKEPIKDVKESEGIENPFDDVIEDEIKKEEEIDLTPEDSKINAEQIIEIKEDIKAVNKEEKNNELIYSSASNALREISGLKITENSTKLEEAKKKFIEIIKISQTLLDQINKI